MASFVQCRQKLQGFLEIAGKSLFGLFAVVFIATIYWKLRFIPRKERYLLTSPESFATQAMHQGFKISWLLTFVLLVFFTVTTKKDHSYFPTEFYLNLALFFMLAVFSISLFFLFQGGDKEQKAGQ